MRLALKSKANRMTEATTLLKTPLHALHETLGASFVPFAGYAMPVQYKLGVLGEHLQCRRAAGLFDVSHMGQLRLRGTDAAQSLTIARALETLVPGDIQGLGPNRTRYTLLTTESGGIIDDLMVTQRGDHLSLVVNAATKAGDIAHLVAGLGPGVVVENLSDRALLALQGPAASSVMARLAPELVSMPFMSAASVSIAGQDCLATRSGYTGEDGWEISVPSDGAEALARRLLAEKEVAPIGLGARDSLRLEAGLCLYGQDIDRTTTPIEAGLAWSIGKRRRIEGGFPGAEIIRQELAEGPKRKRVGILPDGKAPARPPTEIMAEQRVIGRVTSGGFGPSLGGPLAIGYVDAAYAAPGGDIQLMVRGTPRPAKIVPLPFIPHRYFRG
jgi:aminomethyltransferase